MCFLFSFFIFYRNQMFVFLLCRFAFVVAAQFFAHIFFIFFILLSFSRFNFLPGFLCTTITIDAGLNGYVFELGYMQFLLLFVSVHSTYNSRSRSSLSASLVNESVSVYSSRLRRQHGGLSSSSSSLQCSNSSLWCSNNMRLGNNVSQPLQL